MIDSREFRSAVGCFASGVTVVTLRARDGSPRGFTANAFCSVALDPPLVLVCLDHRSESRAAMSAPGVAFAVNILAQGQEEVARIFAGKGGPAKFDGVAHEDSSLGVPVLDGVHAVIECRSTAIHPGGDHDIVVGEAQRVEADSEARPLVFHRGAFGALAQPRLGGPRAPLRSAAGRAGTLGAGAGTSP